MFSKIYGSHLKIENISTEDIREWHTKNYEYHVTKLKDKSQYFHLFV